MSYDAHGDRFAKTVGTATTYYLVDRNNLTEYSATGAALNDDLNSLTAVAGSALGSLVYQIAEASRQLAEVLRLEAKRLGRAAGNEGQRLLKQINIVPISKSSMPGVARHVEIAIAAGKPFILQRTTKIRPS